jgi:hypothetical protein
MCRSGCRQRAGTSDSRSADLLRSSRSKAMSRARTSPLDLAISEGARNLVVPDQVAAGDPSSTVPGLSGVAAVDVSVGGDCSQRSDCRARTVICWVGGCCAGRHSRLPCGRRWARTRVDAIRRRRARRHLRDALLQRRGVVGQPGRVPTRPRSGRHHFGVIFLILFP